MSSELAAAARLSHWPVLWRVIPFAVFIALLAAEPWLAGQFPEGGDARWLYGIRCLLVALILLLLRRRYAELSLLPLALRDIALAIAVGLGVLFFWLLLDAGYFVLGQPGSGFSPLKGSGEIDWSLALMRLAGSALLVPVMEELFWRSLLMRWLEAQEFADFAPHSVGLRAVLLSSLLFGFEHSHWLAGILAGLAYAGLYRRSGQLWLAIIAHAVTNAGLGVWVVVSGAWYFW